MDKALEYIYSREGVQQEIMLVLHDMLMSNVGITNKIRYKVPFYYYKSWICYINPHKKGHVEFCFLRGNELSNAQGILDSKGRKQVCSLTFHSVDDIPERLVHEIIPEAILLDETVPYASKRKKK